VPVCLPWFGPNAAKPELPAHGFARLLDWSVTGVTESSDGVEVHLQLNSNQAPKEMRVGEFIADLRFSIGRDLRMTLTMRNTGSSPLTFEEAMHTYYTVSDVRNISVSGLQGVEYISKAEGGVRKKDEQPAIKFTGETDRGYLNTESTCTIDDPGLKRKIIVAKSNSKTTVVWNPFPRRAAELTDIGADNWPGFVCVETANVMENKITLPAGESHEMAAHVRVESTE
jgi:D-hexose-6-phosphate mutarotase